VIEALEPNQADFKNGVVRLGNDVAKNGGAKGIVIEAESGILLNSVNAYTDGKLKLVSPNGEVKLATSSEYNSLVMSYTKDRGGVAGTFGGTKTHYKKEESSTPLISRIVAAVIEFVTPKNIEIGIDIITYAVEFNRDGATKDSMISIIPKMATYYIETKTTKKGLLFEFSDSGNFIFAGSKTKGEGRAEVEVIPTVIQLGGITDDPNNPPRFLLYSKGTFQMVSSRIEEYRDQSGNLVEGRKSVIIIQTDNIVLESVPHSKFVFGVLDEKGVGIGFNTNSGEVALKAGLFGYKEQSATVETKHNNPPSFFGKYLLLNATNSLKDVQAVYDFEQMEIHAKIIFHGVAKDSVTKTDLTRIMEVGAKIGIKFGSLGRMVDAASRPAEQDFNTPEGIINGGFAAFQGYHEALRLMTGAGGMGAGAWAFAHYSEEKSTSTITEEIPTVIKAGSLEIETESWELVGTQVAAYRAYIKAKNVKTRPAQMSRDSSSSRNSLDVEIPLTAGAPISLSVGLGGSKGHERLMMNARIHIHEDLRLEVTGHADMKGVSLSAKSLEAFFNSLLLESIQDISRHTSWGINLGLSSIDISSIGGQIGDGERHVVRELTSILGSENCNIVVANALRLNGAMIAAAHRADDGTYSDHGALTLSVGELFVQHIYDYDNGHTLGAAISTIAFMPTVGGRDGEGETFATIGKTVVKCTTEGGTCETDQANRDVANPQTWTQHYDIDPITAYILIEPLPNLPRTPDGKINWDVVNGNVKGQFAQVFDNLAAVFFDPIAAPDPTSPDTQSDEPLTTLEKAKLAVAVKEAEDKAKKIKLLFEEGQATDDNEASTEPGICLLPEYQIFYDAYDPTYPYKEAKISGTKEPGILEGRGKTAVRYIKEIMAEYNQFAQDNPKLARYALSAISMTLKTTIGAIQGAIVGSVIPGVGTIIGAISSGSRSFAVAAVDEVRGEVIAAVAGDEIAAGIQKGAELTAPALMKADSTLSKDEAELLVKFTALATMSSHDLAQGIKTLAKTVKPKHAFAEGIDIDDYHGKNSGDSLDDIAVFKNRDATGTGAGKADIKTHADAGDFGSDTLKTDFSLYAESILKNKAKFIAEHDFYHTGTLTKDYAETFTGHKYKKYILTEDTILYRAGSKDFAFGDYFSFNHPISEIQIRMDKALKHVWPDGHIAVIDSVHEIKFPKSTYIYVGNVANQGGAYFGGTHQIVVPNAKGVEGTKVIKSYPIKK
jgi:hypothetical protein